MGKPFDMIKHVEDRLGHDFRYSINSAKMHELGWMPRTDFDEALDSTIEWYLKNDEWMKAVSI